VSSIAIRIVMAPVLLIRSAVTGNVSVPTFNKEIFRSEAQ